MSVAVTEAPAVVAEQGGTRPRTALLVLVAAELLILFAPVMQWLYGRWTMSVWHHAHGLLIPPVVAWFCYDELRRFKGQPVTGSAWGFAFLVPALALHAIDTTMHTQLLAAVALVLALPGLSLLLLGVPRTRAILFPLAFTAFALPIPLSMTESLHLALRQVATKGVTTLLPLLNVPFHSEATTIYLTRGTVQIADACSGFSTLYAALAVACLLAYSARNWKQSAVTLVAAVPIAIGANILRVLLLVALVAFSGEAVLDTWIHPASGMMTFAIALPALFWIARTREETKGAAR